MSFGGVTGAGTGTFSTELGSESLLLSFVLQPFWKPIAGDPLQSPFKIGSSRFFTSIRRNMKLKNPDLFFVRA